jgi:HD-GYP domain-containing protein (c-di-GMP phosphodiesterase class II)
MRGAALLEADGTLTRGAIEAVRHHHERWDGGGFPFGLAGTAIPLGARLVGICEAFDEMIHSTARKREPMSVRRALEELLRQRGRRFDPQLVDLLIERVRRLQRDEGGLDEAVEAEADRSTYVLARRQMQSMLNEAPAGPDGDGA